MPRTDYQKQLDALRADVQSMGELVLEQVDRSLEALDEGDEDLAREVVDGDDEINELYLGLESDCIELFALQQPVASDLRFIAASFKIITDLERIGDLATNFGEYTVGADHGLATEIDAVRIGTDARDLVADALDAYAAADANVCHRVAERDDEIDALCQHASDRVVRDLIEREASDDPWRIEQLMDDVSRALLTIRDIERVADHGVNIAARTLYMVENDPELIY